MSKSYVSEAMREAVGRRLRLQVSYPVSESDIRKWALAVYYPRAPPQEFIDPDYARGRRWGGIVAPQEFNPFNWVCACSEGIEPPAQADAPDRTEIMLGIEPPHLHFQLNGGLETEYGEPMRPGDVITSISRLAGYYEREGRLGRMLFTLTEDIWTNQRGEFVKRTLSTGIRY
ncbi:MAG: MaoC family dehydratase N-terminal domain-containing protein [Caulobacteraceae bacterium]|nr:MaoC family dehydratase N-terminal domain-containing protein [Caulobacteraceae bacterium]